MKGDLQKNDLPLQEAGFITFYGLYWKKSVVDWRQADLLGRPRGWTGRGRTAKDADPKNIQMNFWKQKGVYILYDNNLSPVYAGQAGLVRKTDGDGRTIGGRLRWHTYNVYRNGWSLFSWFGFLELEKFSLKEAGEQKRMDPPWEFVPKGGSPLNQLLASFEAILIEGFAPRFNARGGDLGKAVLVDQYDPELYGQR